MQRRIKNKCKHDWLCLSKEGSWCKECGTLKYKEYKEGKAVNTYRIPSALITIETETRKKRLCAICQSAIDGGSLY